MRKLEYKKMTAVGQPPGVISKQITSKPILTLARKVKEVKPHLYRLPVLNEALVPPQGRHGTEGIVDVTPARRSRSLEFYS